VLPVVPDEWKEVYGGKVAAAPSLQAVDDDDDLVVMVPDDDSGDQRQRKLNRRKNRMMMLGKNTDTTTATTSDSGSSKDFAIVVLDEEETRVDQEQQQQPPLTATKSARDLLKEKQGVPLLPDHWLISDGDDAREKILVKIFDQRSFCPIGRGCEQEILRVMDAFEKSVESQRKEHESIPRDFSGFSADAQFKVTTIERIQNYSLLRFYSAALEELSAVNEARSLQDRAEVIEDTIAFHGTKYQHAVDIALSGPRTAENKLGVYGWGFYLSRQKLNVPATYALKRYPDETPTLVFGRCLVGRNSPTIRYQNRPNPGDDTGGIGNSYIHVVFQNTHFYPEYLIKIEQATHDEWEQQVQSVRQQLLLLGVGGGGASVASSSSLPSTVIVPPPLPPPPVAAPVMIIPPPPSPAPPAVVAPMMIIPPPPPPPPPSVVRRVAPMMRIPYRASRRTCTCGKCFAVTPPSSSPAAAAVVNPPPSGGAPGPSSSAPAAAPPVGGVVPSSLQPPPPPSSSVASSMAAPKNDKKRSSSSNKRSTMAKKRPRFFVSLKIKGSAAGGGGGSSSSSSASSSSSPPASPGPHSSGGSKYKPDPPTSSDDDDDNDDDSSDPTYKPVGASSSRV
jgi:hypothetical protein